MRCVKPTHTHTQSLTPPPMPMVSQMAILHRSRFLLSKAKATSTTIRSRSMATFQFLSKATATSTTIRSRSIATFPFLSTPNPADTPLPPRPTTLSESYNALELDKLLTEYMMSEKWDEVKDLFEAWVRSLDKNGKPNMPDVNHYNYYLWANLMMGASFADMQDLVSQMKDFNVVPNAASYSLVLKAMVQPCLTLAAKKLFQRVEQVRARARAVLTSD